MSNITEKLRKLLELSRRGVGGERANALELLEALMRKHRVSMADLGVDERVRHYFTPPKGQFGRRLLFQTFGAVGLDSSWWSNRNWPGKIGKDVTPAERIEIEMRVAAYVPELNKSLDICFRAFVQTNKIFSEKPDNPESEIDHETAGLTALAMLGMTKVSIHRALTDSTEVAK
jgi:hypothetical protein